MVTGKPRPSPNLAPYLEELTLQKSFCGSGSDYCGGGCQPEYGNCGTNITANTTLGNPACSWAGEGTSPRCDGRCGSNFNNSICNSAGGPDDFVQFGVFGYGPCCR